MYTVNYLSVVSVKTKTVLTFRLGIVEERLPVAQSINYQSYLFVVFVETKHTKTFIIFTV